MNLETGRASVINLASAPLTRLNHDVPGQFKTEHRIPRAVPMESLYLLFETACRMGVGGQVARSFLYWLIGQEDPTGCKKVGGIELRRLDSQQRQAALEVLEWWVNGTESDQPIYDVLERLDRVFGK